MIPDYVDITGSINDSLTSFFRKNSYSQISILVDENTLKYCYPIIKNSLPDHQLIEIPSGEENKNLQTCGQIWEALTLAAFDRSSLLVNLGGGVIGDMGGFCAAVYKRGIHFIQIPTSLLAQVDASVGGKLGIDFQNFKNHLGVFGEPEKVIVYPEFLATLPERQIKSGYAEVIKHSLIRDRQAFEALTEIKDITSFNWMDTIRSSISIKSEIVDQDPLEKGPRKLLNFGHTIGHAIESQFLENRDSVLLHGEAIAIGMICESWLSTKKTGLSSESLEQVVQYILKVFGKPDTSEIDTGKLKGLIKQDKKNKDNKILITLLSEIGKGTFDVDVSLDEALDSLEYYKSL